MFYRRTPSNLSKEFLIREMRLMNELLIPGIFGYDVQKNLTRLQDIIDDNSMSILDVVKLVCTKNLSHLGRSRVKPDNFLDLSSYKTKNKKILLTISSL